MSKLRASTFCCAFSSALLIQGWTIASSSLRPSFCSMPSMRSRPKMRIRSSSQRQEEMRVAGVALAAGAAAQLVVDAAALVALGADDVEAAGGEAPSALRPAISASDRVSARLARSGLVLDAGELVARCRMSSIAAELDVGAAAGHVGGDGHRARHAGLGDDVGFLLVIARVQHLVRHLLLLEQFRQVLRLLDRGGADQHRLAALAAVADDADDRLVLLGGRAIDLVVVVDAGDRDVGRDLDHLEPVDVEELRPPRSAPCRSCRRACRTCGSSSGR